MPTYTYPPAHASDTVDDFHGTPVPDPYRWLEDMNAPETRRWLEAQAALTDPYLAGLPQRPHIKSRLTEIWNFPRYTPPVRKGSRYFFFRNDGLQNQSVLYMQEGLTGEPLLVLDPNTLSEDGTVAVYSYAFSDDGKYLAYGRSSGGSDLQEVYIRDIDSGRDLEETLKWGRFVGIAWKHDNSGLYYNRYAEPGTVPDSELYFNNQLYFHRLGTPQSADALVYARPDRPEMGFWSEMSHDGDYLLLQVWHAASTRNRLYYRPEPNGPVIELIDDPTAKHQFIGNQGSTFYILTDKDAPLGRIVAIDTANPAAGWRDMVAEGTDVLQSAALVKDKLIVLVLHDAYSRLLIYDLNGQQTGEIPLPAMGSVFTLSTRPDSDEVFFSFESFLYPPMVFRWDMASQQLTTHYPTGLTLPPNQYETTQVFATSKDGARVPVFLTHKRGLKPDGDMPTLLEAYGGYGVNNTPYFAQSSLYWVEQGGIYALAILRGGGEYGESWHEGGMLGNKQNCFNDFIGAAEYLIGSGYTRPGKLAIKGASNGGLLVAACMLQRPELYGAVICGVPVTDMLRFHRFTAGRFWTDEYGNAEANPEDFRYLYAYSPLHNVQPGAAYPPILVTTAESDDRVVPLHAMKFTAALQAASGGHNQALLRFEFKAGHGFGKPTAKLIDEISDEFAFALAAFR